jgi:hypothetical protein
VKRNRITRLSLPWDKAVAETFHHLAIVFHELGNVLRMNLLDVGSLSNDPAQIIFGNLKSNQPTDTRQRLVRTAQKVFITDGIDLQSCPDEHLPEFPLSSQKGFAAGNDGLETDGVNMDLPNLASLKFTSGQPELQVTRLARSITVILREGPSKDILPNSKEDDDLIPFQNLDHQSPVVPEIDSL